MHTALQRIICAGVLIVALSDWGSPTSVVTLIILLFTAVLIPLGKWGYNSYLRKNPFTVEHSYKKGPISDPTENDVRSGKAQTEIAPNFLSSKDLRVISHAQSEDRHVIYLELNPRKSWILNGVSLRVVGDQSNKPSLISIHDINQQALNISRSGTKRDSDIGVWYSPSLNSNKNKALDYLVQFFSKGGWIGDLILTVHLFNEDARQIDPIKIRIIDET